MYQSVFENLTPINFSSFYYPSTSLPSNSIVTLYIPMYHRMLTVMRLDIFLTFFLREIVIISVVWHHQSIIRRGIRSQSLQSYGLLVLQVVHLWVILNRAIPWKLPAINYFRMSTKFRSKSRKYWSWIGLNVCNMIGFNILKFLSILFGRVFAL